MDIFKFRKNQKMQIFHLPIYMTMTLLLRPSFLIVSLLHLLPTSFASSPQPRQIFANEPSPQTAVKGTTVVLPCRIINKVGELQWTRDGFGLGNERELFAFKRYTMIGSDEEGDYSLRISPVTLMDDSEFQCQVTGWRDIPGVRSQTAKLTVYVQPEQPEILQGSVIRTTAGKKVQLECTSNGGKPAAEIQWMDGSGHVIVEGVTFSKKLLEDRHRYDSTSTLSLDVSRKHHNEVFTCTATNPAHTQPLRAQVRLEVTYPPVVTLSSDRESYKEGERAILTCVSSANPNQLTYRWYVGGKLVAGSNKTVYSVNKLTRESGLRDITCEAENEIGSTKKTTRLSIHYGPSFRENPSDVYADMGEQVTLECQVDGSPEPKIVWIPQKNSSYIFGNKPRLNLNVTSETVGTYMCLAKVADFPEISSNVGLFLKGPPVMKAERIQWGMVGDISRLECFVPSATPNSINVSWVRRGGEKLETNTGRYKVEKDTLGDGVLVSLVITRAEEEDFDTYKCTVENNFGSDVMEVIFRSKKSLPMFLLLMGVGGGGVFVLALAIGIVIYGRRSSNRHKDTKPSSPLEKGNGTTLQAADQYSTGNGSDLKVEIDNHTGSSLSSKEPDLDRTWEKDEHPHTPTYISSTTSYLYPENFTGIPLKTNGQLTHSKQPMSYSDYLDHGTLTSSSKQLPPRNSTTLTYATDIYSPRSLGGPLITSSQQNLYPIYQHEYEPPAESVEGLRGLSAVYGSGFNNFKGTASTLPLSVHGNKNSAISASIRPETSTIRSPPLTSTASNIPRLGIPVDPSQYIVSPRTHVMQGALATHV